ncbi:unnamed protein product, partial [Pseudo-nitzschia multistriata]
MTLFFSIYGAVYRADRKQSIGRQIAVPGERYCCCERQTAVPDTIRYDTVRPRVRYETKRYDTTRYDTTTTTAPQLPVYEHDTLVGFRRSIRSVPSNNIALHCIRFRPVRATRVTSLPTHPNYDAICTRLRRIPFRSDPRHRIASHRIGPTPGPKYPAHRSNHTAEGVLCHTLQRNHKRKRKRKRNHNHIASVNTAKKGPKPTCKANFHRRLYCTLDAEAHHWPLRSEAKPTNKREPTQHNTAQRRGSAATPNRSMSPREEGAAGGETGRAAAKGSVPPVRVGTATPRKPPTLAVVTSCGTRSEKDAAADAAANANAKAYAGVALDRSPSSNAAAALLVGMARMTKHRREDPFGSSDYVGCAVRHSVGHTGSHSVGHTTSGTGAFGSLYPAPPEPRGGAGNPPGPLHVPGTIQGTLQGTIQSTLQGIPSRPPCALGESAAHTATLNSKLRISSSEMRIIVGVEEHWRAIRREVSKQTEEREPETEPQTQTPLSLSLAQSKAPARASSP